MRKFDYLNRENVCTSLSGTRINQLFVSQEEWKYDHVSHTFKQSLT